MKETQISAQLYSFREFIKTPAGVIDTLKRLRNIGYRSIQLTSALPAELQVAELAAILAESGMKAISSHEPGSDFFNEPDKVIDKLKTLNITHTAYPWPHIPPTGIGEAVVFAHKLNELALKFKEQGITLAYHNHATEFKKLQGKLMLELIYENAPDLAAEIDTFWVQKGGGDPVAWIKRTAGRMEYLHIKDYGIDFHSGNPVMAPIGSGNLNWHEIISTAEKCGVKYFIVEHDGDVSAPFGSFETSFNYLKKNFME